MLICPKCNKFYEKKAYLNKHILNGNCLKTVYKKNEPKPKTEVKLIDQSIDQIVSKFIKKNNEVELVELKNRMDMIYNELFSLKERVKIIETNSLEKYEIKVEKSIEQEKSEIRIIKKEKMNLDDSIISEHLNRKSIESDCDLLFNYYFKDINKNSYPIKKNVKNECVYWNGIDWLEDIGGNYIKGVFTYNLKKAYSKVNVITDAKDTEYIANQEYINNISETNKKYQQHLFNFFIDTYL